MKRTRYRHLSWFHFSVCLLLLIPFICCPTLVLSFQGKGHDFFIYTLHLLQQLPLAVLIILYTWSNQIIFFGSLWFSTEAPLCTPENIYSSWCVIPECLSFYTFTIIHPKQVKQGKEKTREWFSKQQKKYRPLKRFS